MSAPILELCLLSLTTIDNAHDVYRSAFEFDCDVDELEALGLTKGSTEVVRAPRIEEAAISMECVVDRIIPTPPVSDHVVWGRVERFHIRDDVYMPGGRIDTAALGAFGRLAAEYSLIDNIFTTPLPNEVVEHWSATRAARLDDRPTEYSPIDTKEWSASGSTSDRKSNMTTHPTLANGT